MPLTIIVILTIGLLFIQFIWIATDRSSVIQYLVDTMRGSIRKTFFLVVFILICQLITGFLIPLPVTKYDLLLTFVGLGIYELGIALAIWAKLTMKDSWGYPGEHNIQKQKKLITTGPFTFSRNPIYLSLLIIAFGFGITVKSFLLILVIPLYYYFKDVIQEEERLLEKYFGKEYKDYKSKVRRFFTFS